MKLELDPEWLRSSMKLWREAVDLKIPLRSDLRVHLIGQRHKLLTNFAKISESWYTILKMCKAQGKDLEELQALRADMEAFMQWAAQGLSELRELATEVARRDVPDLNAKGPKDLGPKPGDQS